MNELINLNSKRAFEARLTNKFNKSVFQILLIIFGLLTVIGILLILTSKKHLAIIIFSPDTLILTLILWWHNYLSVIPANSDSLDGRLSKDVLARLEPNSKLTPQVLWFSLKSNWQSNFIVNHLMLTEDLVSQLITSADGGEVKAILDYSLKIANSYDLKEIELGFVVAGILANSSSVAQQLTREKASADDIDRVVNWLARKLSEDKHKIGANFGGIGRDWSFGYTPLLDKLGNNISRSIQKVGTHFGSLKESETVKSLEQAFINQAPAIALVGPVGIGKSNSVYSFAQKLIEGSVNSNLAYHQVVSINATNVVSNAQSQGDLERIMINLANEAAHAGHIILFLDDAQSFINSGPGAFDASQILVSIIEHRSVPLILALTPKNFEEIKAKNSNLASLLTPIKLNELPKDEILKVLEDQATALENKDKILVVYESLKSAYNLSGRYNSDEAYPGKAIKLLESATAHTIHSVLMPASIEQAVQQSSGVNVASASPIEAEELMNLESLIHQRMINQEHAVSTVAGALRRARAGVASPNRPIGSFLFLGPTGVGKTELAKSLAATYFKDESNMIRIDMTEFQDEDSVKRLLGDGVKENENTSLILAIRQKPFSVILLDEVEKAHPNVLNLLLQLLDEGRLTDLRGRTVSFKDSIIIATSNAGAQSIRNRVSKGEQLKDFESELIEEIISSNTFKPELINRFDDIVLFRPLTPEELELIVGLMINEINKTLTTQNISVSLDKDAVKKIVKAGYDPRLGARPMRRTLQKAVEDIVAKKILSKEANPGDKINLTAKDLKI